MSKEEIESFIEPIMSTITEMNPKIICFSEEIKSNYMWAHYAQGHKGFAVGYDFSELEDDNPFFEDLFPVMYDQDYALTFHLAKEFQKVSRLVPFKDPAIFHKNIKLSSLFSSLLLQILSLNKNEIIVPDEILKLLFQIYSSTKGHPWWKEKEWRYIELNSEPSNLRKLPKPKATYLGHAMDKKREN